LLLAKCSFITIFPLLSLGSQKRIHLTLSPPSPWFDLSSAILFYGGSRRGASLHCRGPQLMWQSSGLTYTFLSTKVGSSLNRLFRSDVGEYREIFEDIPPPMPPRKLSGYSGSLPESLKYITCSLPFPTNSCLRMDIDLCRLFIAVVTPFASRP
jgi:hypothetical protein